MPDPFGAVSAAELALFARKEAALGAAAEQGLPGRFATFRLGGLRAVLATAEHLAFLNTIEGLTDRSVEALPAALERFTGPHRPAVVATSPSPALVDRLVTEAYQPAPVRPLAYLRLGTDVNPVPRPDESWQIHEVSAGETTAFLDLLGAGYATSSEVTALIQAEHALPSVRGFIASRHDQALAAAAMSVHANAAVLGGAATLPAARGSGAQTALVAHRLRLVEALGLPVATASAAPGTASVRNLAALGFTIVERTAWTAPVSTARSTRRPSGSASRSG